MVNYHYVSKYNIMSRKFKEGSAPKGMAACEPGPYSRLKRVGTFVANITSCTLFQVNGHTDQFIRRSQAQCPRLSKILLKYLSMS